MAVVVREHVDGAPGAPMRLEVDRTPGRVPLRVDGHPVRLRSREDPHRAGLRLAVTRARRARRPVRVEMVGPWSTWPVVVHPDGRVDDGRVAGGCPPTPVGGVRGGRSGLRVPGRTSVACALAAVLVLGVAGVVTREAVAPLAVGTGSCRPVTVFAVTGQGQGSTTVSAVTDALSVTRRDRVAVVPVAPPDGGAYAAAEQKAVDGLAGAVRSLASTCPDSHLMLLGWSQGAQVAGDLASRIGTGQEKGVAAGRVVAVGLFGDPARAASGRVVPAAAPGQGVLPPRAAGFGALTSRTIEICAPDDPVCAATSPQAAPSLDQAGAAPAHARYDALVLAPNVTATQWASQSLGTLADALVAGSSSAGSGGSGGDAGSAEPGGTSGSPGLGSGTGSGGSGSSGTGSGVSTAAPPSPSSPGPAGTATDTASSTSTGSSGPEGRSGSADTAPTDSAPTDSSTGESGGESGGRSSGGGPSTSARSGSGGESGSTGGSSSRTGTRSSSPSGGSSGGSSAPSVTSTTTSGPGGGGSSVGTGASSSADASGASGSSGGVAGVLWSMTNGLASFHEPDSGDVQDGGEQPVSVASPNVPGRQAVQVDVPSGGMRSEVEPGGPTAHIQSGAHLFFGLSDFIPQGFPVDTSGYCVIWQLHDGGTNSSPPVALEINQGHLRLANVGSYIADLGTVTAGQNLAVQVEVQFAEGGGSVSVWRDGKQVAANVKPPKGTMVDSYDYLKNGVYKHKTSADGDAKLYINDDKVGSSLAAVSNLAGASTGAGAGSSSAAASPTASPTPTPTTTSGSDPAPSAEAVSSGQP